MLQTVFRPRSRFVQGFLRCLAWIACSEGNIAILDWVHQFGVELRSTAPIGSAVGRGDVKLLQWFYENGFEVTGPGLLEPAAENGRLDAVRWLTEHGVAVHLLEVAKIAAKHKNVPVMRWLVEQGPSLDLPTATLLVVEYRYIEVAWWVAEKDRGDLVLKALQNNDRNVVWWILMHTQFQEENTRREIHDAIQRCPRGTQQWLKNNMNDV
ncbi:hypothetical protein PHYSODRAFT_303245 [Phytophthora sojae]|uniref:Uncharacterized protein n=1 Tax=Phytophthora sojae (strain P6497) TaxID=1094619 RepID=G4ZRP4_PHYSP|nr:hypothetical protein PHYSODRAFT_303245 [Phytophthora sojae]EGZ13853.1 hypothetical protein PHYSODRAFT_303245 [Phytophthora sojae]|eukprot:XP_009531282.1 hypothetical protein PHYSODRAFT_303245 [Phytophthora sojae]